MYTISLTIKNGQSTSEIRRANGGVPVAIKLSPAWTTAALSFIVNNAPLRTMDGGPEYSVNASADMLIPLQSGLFSGADTIQICSGTNAAPIAQGQDVTIEMYCVPTPLATVAPSAVEASLGSASDAPASTDAGTFSLIALFKRLLAKWAAGLGISQVTLDPLCAENTAGERIICAVAGTNYASSAIPAGTIAVQIKTPSYDVLVNINADASIAAGQNGAIAGQWVMANSQYRLSIKAADIGHTLRFMFESATAQNVDITWITQ
jgi:hypothetical protein